MGSIHPARRQCLSRVRAVRCRSGDFTTCFPVLELIQPRGLGGLIKGVRTVIHEEQFTGGKPMGVRPLGGFQDTCPKKGLLTTASDGPFEKPLLGGRLERPLEPRVV
jgi:hypothetical protein